MEQSSFQDEQTVRHQFDSLCKLALKSEVINYEKHMAYRQKYEVMLSELSEKELSRLFIMDEHEMETHRFQVLGYDIEVKDALIAEALQTLTEKKRNVVLLSYFMDMSDADIAREMNEVTDENFVECGVDIPGELQIGGGSLAKGYINDEELTMKKFITDIRRHL